MPWQHAPMDVYVHAPTYACTHVKVSKIASNSEAYAHALHKNFNLGKTCPSQARIGNIFNT